MTGDDANDALKFPTAASANAPRSLKRIAVASMVAVALLMLSASAFALGRGQQAKVPDEGSPEAGFARDMAMHHAQAVDMAERIRERTTDPELRTLAKDIGLGQQAQIGQMRGWLDQWQLSPTGAQPPLAWMGSDGHDSMSAAGTASGTGARAQMPGMVTNERLEAISTAPIVEGESLFLSSMIDHHMGGVVMAKAALDRTERPEVRNLATSIVNAQESEIRIMTELLAQRPR